MSAPSKYTISPPVPVKGGRVLEVCLAQFWAQLGGSLIDIEVTQPYSTPSFFLIPTSFSTTQQLPQPIPTISGEVPQCPAVSNGGGFQTRPSHREGGRREHSPRSGKGWRSRSCSNLNHNTFHPFFWRRRKIGATRRVDSTTAVRGPIRRRDHLAQGRPGPLAQPQGVFWGGKSLSFLTKK